MRGLCPGGALTAAVQRPKASCRVMPSSRCVGLAPPCARVCDSNLELGFIPRPCTPPPRRLRDHFMVTNPTHAYAQLLACVPDEFVASSSRLVPVIQVGALASPGAAPEPELRGFA